MRIKSIFLSVFCLTLSLMVFSSVVISQAPIITFVKVPHSVTVGTSFNVDLKIVSKNKIAFLNVWFENISRKIYPKNIKGNFYMIKLIAKSPGEKILKIYAVDKMNNSGKLYNKKLYVYKKTAGTFDNNIFGTQVPEKPVQNKPDKYKFLESPPQFKLDSHFFCAGDTVKIRGKYFTGDLKVRIGNRKIKIDKFTDIFIQFSLDEFSAENYLYVKNNVGETKSRYPVRIRCTPKIFNFSPPEVGENDILEINGKYLSYVNQIPLSIKNLGIDKIYYLDIIGKPGENEIRVKMPSLLHYPGSAFIRLNSQCGISNKAEITIKDDGVTYLSPTIKGFYPNKAAPGSNVFVYLSHLSVPEKEKFKVSFNNLNGIVKELNYSIQDSYILKVLIPDNVNNIVDNNQKIRVTSFGNTRTSKDNFYLFGRPEITKVENAQWSEKYVEITGNNFRKDWTFVYFTGINGKWESSNQVNFMGYKKISVKLPFIVKKGFVKIKTYINGIYQECISKFVYDPEIK